MRVESTHQVPLSREGVLCTFTIVVKLTFPLLNIIYQPTCFKLTRAHLIHTKKKKKKKNNIIINENIIYSVFHNILKFEFYFEL
jgi:hypothetical protein